MSARQFDNSKLLDTNHRKIKVQKLFVFLFSVKHSETDLRDIEFLRILDLIVVTFLFTFDVYELKLLTDFFPPSFLLV